ncbi:MAG TPA: DUF2723 domain-containing protein [Candidatus Hydrogenedentes bacterium]|nr:DUF2723 domain-containing protein [Candidatus Hydrogenedentota bacterium]
MNSRKRQYGLAFLAATLAFIVYSWSAAPSVGINDAGELAGAAATLGIAHPTGYPLFILLAHAWTWLPIPGSTIHALNLFAAFCVACAVALFFDLALLLLRRLFPDQPHAVFAAFCSALLFAFARTVWDQATGIEVYSLHLFLLLLNLRLFLAAVFDDTDQRRWWLLWAACLGLAFANHMTTIMLAPAMLFLYFFRMGIGWRAWKCIGWMLLPFVAALSIYVYLPWRSSGAFPFQTPPEFDWGGVGRGLYWFSYHVTGRQYGTGMWSGEIAPQAKTLASVFFHQFAFIGVIPMLLGIWMVFKRERRLGVFFLLLVIGCLGYALTYRIYDIANYFLLAFIALLACTAIGLMALAAWRPMLIAALALPVIALTTNWNHCSDRGDYRVEDYVRCLMDNVEPNAIVITGQWEQAAAPFFYLQRVEHYRPDVVLVERNLLHRSWYVEQLRRWYPEFMQGSPEAMNILQRAIERFEQSGWWDDDCIAAEVGMINAWITDNFYQRPVYVTPDVLHKRTTVGEGLMRIPEGLALRFWPDPAATPPIKTDLHLDRFIAYRKHHDSLDALDMVKYARECIGMAITSASLNNQQSAVQALTPLMQKLNAILTTPD